MSAAETQFIGTLVSDYVIKEMIGQGAFSWVYRGVHRDGLGNRAFKIPKPAELVGTFTATKSPPTQALAFITGGFTNVRPDAAQLLGLQSRKLQASEDPILVHVEDYSIDELPAYCQMEYIEGQTLRSLMDAGPVPIPVLVHIIRSVERLHQDSNFKYHGDLKPENIMVTEGGVKLLDPGHFGPLDCQEGNLELCIVTTPEYYPILDPNDLFALGIILWEAACDRHPLGQGGFSGRSDLSNVGDELLKWVRYKEFVGQYFLSPILEAGRPSEIRPDIPLQLEKVLLKATQLRIRSDGKVDKDPGFGSLTELAEALEGLLSEDIRQL